VRWNNGGIQDLADPGFHLRFTQLYGGRTVEAAGPQIRPHLGPPHPKWLDPVAEECPQEVNPGQPPPPAVAIEDTRARVVFC
jgi:hypothetical protein